MQLESQQWERMAPLVRPGEHVLWVGGPDPRKRFSRGDALLVPFSLVWCGFAVFWTVAATAEGAPLFMTLWGSMFVLVGLYLVAGRFVVKRHRSRRTLYALTTERALVLTGDRSVEDMPLADQPVSVHRSRDGRHATVTIGATTIGGHSAAWGQAVSPAKGWPSYGRGDQAFAFHDVPEPARCSTALDTARQRSAHGTAG